MSERNLRKTLIGIVESNKMDKTIVVKVETAVRHPIYKKIVKRSILMRRAIEILGTREVWKCCRNILY